MSMLRKSWEWEKRLWWSQLVWRHSNFSKISFVLCVFKLKSHITTWFLCYPLKLTQEITLLLNTVPLNSHQMEPVLNLFTSEIQLRHASTL